MTTPQRLRTFVPNLYARSDLLMSLGNEIVTVFLFFRFTNVTLSIQPIQGSITLITGGISATCTPINRYNKLGKFASVGARTLCLSGPFVPLELTK